MSDHTEAELAMDVIATLNRIGLETEPERADDGSFILRHGRAPRLFGWFFLGFGLLAGICTGLLALHDPDWFFQEPGAVWLATPLVLLFILAGVQSLVSAANSALLAEDGLVASNGKTGRVKSIYWDEVCRVQYSRMYGGFVLQDLAGTKIRVSASFHGFWAFLTALEDRLDGTLTEKALSKHRKHLAKFGVNVEYECRKQARKARTKEG